MGVAGYMKIQKNTGKVSAKKNRARYLIWPLALAVLIFATASALLLIYHNSSDNRVIATVNNEPVSVGEFKLQVKKNKALVSGYFKGKYNANDSKDFWTTGFDGEVPVEKLKRDSLDSCILMKVQQMMAMEKGLLQDITYGKFLRELQAENRKRKDYLKNNRVFYGPEQYDKESYYNVVTGNMVSDLKKLLTKDMQLDDERMWKYYEAFKDKLFKKQDTIRVYTIYSAYLSGEKGSKAEVEKLMTDIKDSLDKGMDVKAAVEPYNGKVKVEEQIFDSKSGHKDSIMTPVLFSEAIRLFPGQLSDVFEENGAVFLVKCMDRKSNGYQSFEDSKDRIQQELVEEEYGKRVQNRVNAVSVVINKKVYESIGVEVVR
jgi:hypothetical protein